MDKNNDIESAPLKSTEETSGEISNEKEVPNINDIFNKRMTCSMCALSVLVIFSFIGILLALMHGMYGGDIEASIHYRDSECLTSKYGCCEIFTGCNIKNDHIDYNSRIIKRGGGAILANDNLKSNCLSLDYLISKYNSEYNKNNCGKYGCCHTVEFNTRCDDTIRKTFVNGNNLNIINEFKNTTSPIQIKISKIDETGSNCIINRNRLLWDIIDSYNYNYPEKLTILEEVIKFLSICAIILCIIGCIAENSKGRRRYR